MVEAEVNPEFSTTLTTFLKIILFALLFGAMASYLMDLWGFF